jgi:hypothetical protein
MATPTSNKFHNTLVLEGCPAWARDEIAHHFWRNTMSIRNNLCDAVFSVNVEGMDALNQVVFVIFQTSNTFADVPAIIVQEICRAIRKHIRAIEKARESNHTFDKYVAECKKYRLNPHATEFNMTAKIQDYAGEMRIYYINNGVGEGKTVLPVHSNIFGGCSETDFPVLVR